jgi:hypothetical protein
MSANENDSAVDELVATTYRATANETVPQHLNERVLGMAANPKLAGKPSSWLASAWTKPLAWVATVGLSVAMVLEITLVSSLPEPGDAAIPAVESVRDDFVPRDTTALDQALQRAQLQNGPSQEFACAVATRKTATAWYACIDDLRSSGRSIDAAHEFESFARKYPDFLPDK